MKKLLPFNPLFLYILIICLVAIGEAFAVKATILQQPINKEQKKFTKPTIAAIPISVEQGEDDPIVAEADSIDFDVEVVQPRKFLLSFTKKREETFFIKIYDVIGNLIHHEVVSKKGKFRKHYDLSKYKTELYVIEVGSSKKAKIKRLFLG
jgi:hypothetical protein